MWFLFRCSVKEGRRGSCQRFQNHCGIVQKSQLMLHHNSWCCVFNENMKVCRCSKRLLFICSNLVIFSIFTPTIPVIFYYELMNILNYVIMLNWVIQAWPPDSGLAANTDVRSSWIITLRSYWYFVEQMKVCAGTNTPAIYLYYKKTLLFAQD